MWETERVFAQPAKTNVLDFINAAIVGHQHQHKHAMTHISAPVSAAVAVSQGWDSLCDIGGESGKVVWGQSAVWGRRGE